ncbi:3-oxoacyl-[acyl-carrier-protein] synthase II, chloroplastic-like isoform X2 [Phoenix dactylifera]|uniref:beta-ketoacyl-[acyl-carrier-protein] synthase I n=1 Tax=Phoenix dactylifera TaxID=42345 RepID=A0A8B9AL54_PHODC|nr:3-oxoacyl-[acyl-carrier-protein] synthase II, chloroplastic-like isoform X2 [Phoenix dactylifera]
MAGYSVAAPLCTWLVAACVTVPRGKEGTLAAPAAGEARLRSRSARRRRAAALRLDARDSSRGLMSALCGSGIQGLMSSCLAFEPCPEFYGSKGASSFFGEGGFSLFGPWKAETTRRQRRAGRASCVSGKAMAVAVQPAKEIAEKKRIHTKKRRVVVTGMGVVTPLGDNPDVFYNNLLEGVSGISQIETFDCTNYPTRIAGEIKSFSTDGLVAPKLSKRMDKFMLYLLIAGKKALADGAVTEEVMSQFDKAKCGVLIGSAMGGMKVFNDAIEALRVSYKKMNPFCVPFATTNMGSAILAMDLGWMGPNYSISTACATSNFCILNAANHIIRGEADVMLCGGSDAAIIPIGLGGFVACRALSQRNSDPTKASRPWDVDRDGFVMGEGAGVLLLEELEHAKQRGANIYAEFLGGSFTCDAYHMTEPHPEGIALCIENALVQAGVAKEDVNYVNAHATSTPVGDLKEYQAIVRCFGQNPELRVNSTKSMIGHLLGASGAVEAVAAIQAIRTGWVHPNINLENPEKSVDMNVLVGSRRERLDVKVALSNSFGFGGHNSSILFAPYK